MSIEEAKEKKEGFRKNTRERKKSKDRKANWEKRKIGKRGKRNCTYVFGKKMREGRQEEIKKKKKELEMIRDKKRIAKGSLEMIKLRF